MSRIRDLAKILTASTDMATDAEVTSSIASHAAAADPHTVYLKESEFNAAGKNAIINGAFDIWQRGTSAALGGSGLVTSADRWSTYTPVTAATLSRQTTSDTTNLPNIQYCARLQRTAGANTAGDLVMANNLETANSIPYAGKTVTISFYARAGANFSAAASAFACYLRTGTGIDQSSTSIGYTGLAFAINTSFTATTTWQRFTATGTIASTATEIALELRYSATGTTAGAADYLEVTGVQLELGSVATPFSRAGGTIQGELAACQRYYYRISAADVYGRFSFGTARTTGHWIGIIQFPVTMRTAPSALDSSAANTFLVYDGTNSITASTVDGIGNGCKDNVNLGMLATGLTQFRPYQLIANNTTAAYLGFSAEL